MFTCLFLNNIHNNFVHRYLSINSTCTCKQYLILCAYILSDFDVFAGPRVRPASAESGYPG